MHNRQITMVTITDDHEAQRVDNFLLRYCKGVPKTRIYRALRKGEVRVNQKRVAPDYRLQCGDELRIPPLRMAQPEEIAQSVVNFLRQRVEQAILVETKDYIILNKPAGIPVHGGTGIQSGIIEALRVLRPKLKYLELAHRLDRDTSGCLLIAKKRRLLVHVHDSWRQHQVEKRYVALLQGQWQGGERTVLAKLRKNQLAGGERIVVVDEQGGKPCKTQFRPLRQFKEAVLVEARLVTGRTHQIRVHAASLGHPIAGDERYGDKAFNKQMRSVGLTRLFLHSSSLYCPLPELPIELLGVCALLPPELDQILSKLAGAS